MSIVKGYKMKDRYSRIRKALKEKPEFRFSIGECAFIANKAGRDFVTTCTPYTIRQLLKERDEMANAILSWWKGHRPISFSVQDHIETPTVNLPLNSDKQLARVAAKIAKQSIRTT